MGEIQFDRPDGGKTRGYLATPAGAVRGNVVVIQEWWGLNDQIRGVADRLASAGYRALAPDLYKGKVVAYESSEEASHNMEGLNWSEAVGQDLKGAVDHLRHMGGKVATLGFCMGGALTILSAVNLGVDVAVCFYGVPPAEAADPSKMKAAFIGHFAQHDYWVSPDKVDALAKQLEAGGVTHEIHRYDAQHAFFNERRSEVYDAIAAKLAWDRSLAFLGRHLG
jgi:carboxymethylenebutenolidase